MDKKILKILEKIEKERDANGNPYWVISHETGQFLNRLIRDNNLNRILEVGTSIGYSGIWLAEALSHTSGMLYTIESNEPRYEMAKKNFMKAGVLDFIKQLKGHAPDVNIPDMFDLLFLDATKAEYISYLKTYLFHMKKGGIIIADNAISHAEELRDYKEYIFNSDQLESELKEIGTGLFISKII